MNDKPEIKISYDGEDAKNVTLAYLCTCNGTATPKGVSSA
jgi:hypothetical protein